MTDSSKRTTFPLHPSQAETLWRELERLQGAVRRVECWRRDLAHMSVQWAADLLTCDVYRGLLDAAGQEEAAPLDAGDRDWLTRWTHHDGVHDCGGGPVG